MNAKLSLKTLYRSPVRMILTFILLVAVTFTLFSQVLEHAVTVREIDKAAEQYDGVGAVEVSLPDTNIADYMYSMDSKYIWNDDCINIGQQYVTLEDGTKLPLRGSPPDQYEALSKEHIANISKLNYVSYVDTRYMTGGVCENLLRLDEGTHFHYFNASYIIEGTLREPTGNGFDSDGCRL